MIAQSRIAANRIAPECTPARTGVNFAKATQAVRDLLAAVGEDPDREGLRDTPARVARMYAELLSGLRQSPADHLSRTFDEACDELVILRHIRFASLCEHHLLPFRGVAHVAYLPAGRVVGLSKLARTVDVYARRPQVQERLNSQIVDAIMMHLQPQGVLAVVQAEHECLQIRGAAKSDSCMVTTAARGVLKTDPDLRREALNLIEMGA